MDLTLVLPWPPSTNHYWRHVGSRVLISKEGREYRKRVTRAIGPGDAPFLTGRLSVRSTCHAPDLRRRDLDNTQKALLDSLCYAGVYADDSQIDKLVVERGEVDRVDPRVVVEITEL